MESHNKSLFIQKQDEEFISVLEAMQIPIALLEPEFNDNNEIIDFIYVLVNELAVKSNGISEEKITGKKLLSILPPHKFNNLFEILKRVYETGKPLQIELNDFTGGPDNSVQGSVKLSITKFKQYIITNWMDNTFIENQTNAIKKLETSNEDLEQFAYIASHDLQEPLRMVASFSQLLKKKYGDKLNAEANEYIDFAVDGAKRMKMLVDDLLVYSRITTTKREWKNININYLLANIIQDFKSLFEENKVKIIYNELPVINSDKAMISRLFTNLISNAVKYRREENPEIKITALKKNSNWIFSVEDNGIGIEKKYFAKIFLLYQRLHSRSDYQGTGIGLAVCKKILDKLGGSIWVESEPGIGSTFYFTIPISE